MSLEPSPLLEVEGLRLWRAGKPLQPPLSFRVVRGKILAVVGPSGVGKSTLLRTLAGLLPVHADRLLLEGQDLTHASPELWTRLRASHLGVLEQELGLLPHLSVEQNVLLPCLLLNLPLSDFLPRMHMMLQALGLLALRAQAASTLSRGQAQRVALVRALLPPRKLLLLDEPDASLDLEARGWTREQLRAAAERGVGLVMSTHDPESMALADEVLRLEVPHGV